MDEDDYEEDEFDGSFKEDEDETIIRCSQMKDFNMCLTSESEIIDNTFQHVLMNTGKNDIKNGISIAQIPEAIEIDNLGNDDGIQSIHNVECIPDDDSPQNKGNLANNTKIINSDKNIQ